MATILKARDTRERINAMQKERLIMSRPSKATKAEKKESAERLATILSTLDSAFEDSARTATDDRKTGTAYSNMATLFGSIIHDLAENLGWDGFSEAMKAFENHKGFAFFGGPYNGKLIISLQKGFIPTMGTKEQRLAISENMAATLADDSIDAMAKIERMIQLQAELKNLN